MTTPQRPTLRQEQQAATRQRLLDAARASFIEHGFVQTTVDRIVESANTSRATFYLHFKNKTDALLHTWSERDLPEVDAMFLAFDAADDFSVAATRAWIERIVGYWESHGRIAMTAVQALALEPGLNENWIGGMTGVTQDMSRLRAALGGDAGLARAIVLSKIIQLERILYFWTNGGLPFERDQLIEVLTREWALAD